MPNIITLQSSAGSKIDELVRKRQTSEQGGDALESKIEKEVANLYGLDRQDLDDIEEFLKARSAFKRGEEEEAAA